MSKKKPYAHLSGSSAYYPYAARTKLRKKQRLHAVLLRFTGAAVLCAALLLFARQTLLRDGQPKAPVLVVPQTAETAAAPPSAGSSALAAQPVPVTIHHATAESGSGAAAGAALTPETAVPPSILEPLRSLYDDNDDLVGWLTVEGTKIDYPVLQTTHDNEYYLRRGFDKLYAMSGSLFVDANCRLTSPTTANWIIYGHNMGNGSMFGTLPRYAKKDFYEAHPTLVFSTLYETSRWQILAALRTNVGDDELPYYSFFDAADEAQWQTRYDAIMADALYETGQTARYGDQLLTLSTCGSSNSFTEKRFAVLAKRLP